jgi:hypothetical protein
LIYFVDAAPFSAYLGFANVSLNSIRMFQISDDAADSPQTINLGGTANPAVVVGPAAGGSTTATVAAGQTASYNFQITPGPGYTGTVALAYSGAPLAASIQAPSSLQISNGNTTLFTVMVTTSGRAAAPPFYFAPRSMPFPSLRTRQFWLVPSSYFYGSLWEQGAV